jgi:hypothetical protein
MSSEGTVATSCLIIEKTIFTQTGIIVDSTITARETVFLNEVLKNSIQLSYPFSQITDGSGAENNANSLKFDIPLNSFTDTAIGSNYDPFDTSGIVNLRELFKLAIDNGLAETSINPLKFNYSNLGFKDASGSYLNEQAMIKELYENKLAIDTFFTPQLIQNSTGFSVKVAADNFANPIKINEYLHLSGGFILNGLITLQFPRDKVEINYFIPIDILIHFV